MANLTRRSFLWQTSAGAAAVGVLAVAPSVISRPNLPDVPAPRVTSAALSEPFVALVRNAAAGEIAVQVGTREIIVRDAELVARLLAAAR
jgi:hypothetical protein